MKVPIHPYAVYDTKETADLLGVEQITIQRYIKSGKLSATRFGKVYRISGQAIIELMSLEQDSVEYAQDRSRQIENATYVRSKAYLMSHPRGIKYIELFDLTARTLIAILNPDYNVQDEDQMTLKYIGTRVFNTAMTAYHDALSGFYQNSFSIQRDLIEIQFLADYFRSNIQEIKEWREADNKTRYDNFSPGKLRQLLDTRDGFFEMKREERYKQFCEYAAHVTYPGFKLLANEQHQIEIGAFYDEKKLINTIHELCLNFGSALIALAACIKISDASYVSLSIRHMEKFDQVFNLKLTEGEKFKAVKSEIDRLLKQLGS